MCAAVPEQKYSPSIHWGLQSQRVQIELALAFRGISCAAHFLWLCHRSWTRHVWKLIHHPKAKFNIPEPNLISLRAIGPDAGWLWNSSNHPNETITRRSFMGISRQMKLQWKVNQEGHLSPTLYIYISLILQQKCNLRLQPMMMLIIFWWNMFSYSKRRRIPRF